LFYFTGLKAGEIYSFAEVISGYTAGGSVALREGELQVNITMVGRLKEGGGTLRGLFGALEGEATRLGANRLVIEGRLITEKLFLSEDAVRTYAKLGYSFKKLADGTIVLTKLLPK
jgi:hypothetical protein